ncbi:IstB_IS21 domain containing protein [Streptomyces venezuelae]|nr:IstB_IS21 domain containing protein [Streptomyces venezuelae]
MRTQFPDLVARAERERLSYRGFLDELLMSECENRDRQRPERRIRAAGLPRQKWLSDFDYSANLNVVPAVVNNLATCDWVKNGEPLCLIGDSGTGKSHPLIRLGAAAALVDRDDPQNPTGQRKVNGHASRCRGQRVRCRTPPATGQAQRMPRE